MESYENNYPSSEKPIESNINEDNASAPSVFPPPSPPIINDIYLESSENNYHEEDPKIELSKNDIEHPDNLELVKYLEMKKELELLILKWKEQRKNNFVSTQNRMNLLEEKIQALEKKLNNL